MNQQIIPHGLKALQLLPINRKAALAEIFLENIKRIESLAIEAKNTPSLKNINDLKKAETDLILSVFGGVE